MNKRIVLDTNVLISGYLWKGSPRQALRLIKQSGDRILTCRESLTELVRVLSSKFKLDSGDISRIVSNIEGMGEHIKISSDAHPIAEDATDNVFINLAIDGRAKVIVSGDSHLLKLKIFRGIRIITVNEFIKIPTQDPR